MVHYFRLFKRQIWSKYFKVIYQANSIHRSEKRKRRCWAERSWARTDLQISGRISRTDHKFFLIDLFYFIIQYWVDWKLNFIIYFIFFYFLQDYCDFKQTSLHWVDAWFCDNLFFQHIFKYKMIMKKNQVIKLRGIHDLVCELSRLY
jgi:hypothetical protein